MKRVLYFGVIAAGMIALPMAAFASHGKAGLWDITISMSGMSGMPDMSKLPPAAQAQMRKMGMSMNGNGMTVQHCMTPQEVATDAPPSNAHSKDCAISNMKITGHSMTGDMVCHGEFTGTGHMQFNYDTDTHYVGEVVMNGTANGHPLTQDTKFEGHWLSADCGSVNH